MDLQKATSFKSLFPKRREGRKKIQNKMTVLLIERLGLKKNTFSKKNKVWKLQK